MAMPLIFAVPFTGSRWAAIVCVVLILGLVAARRLPLKVLPIGVAIAFSILMTMWVAGFRANYGLAGLDSVGAMLSPYDEIAARLAMPHLPSPLPRGVAEHPGLHNVPLRIAYENGILAALVWLGVTGKALWTGRRQQLGGEPVVRHSRQDYSGAKTARIGLEWRQMRFGAVWWVLLAVVLLSLLDYYAWMGHLGGFWWLTIGVLLHRNQSANVSATSREPASSK